MICKTLHRILKIEQHVPPKKTGANWDAPPNGINSTHSISGVRCVTLVTNKLGNKSWMANERGEIDYDKRNIYKVVIISTCISNILLVKR